LRFASQAPGKRTQKSAKRIRGVSTAWHRHESRLLDEEQGEGRLIYVLDAMAAGAVYIGPAMTGWLSHREMLPPTMSRLADRELAIFALIAAEQGVGRIAKRLCISRTTVETHCEHIKLKLGYNNAEELKRGARKLLRRA
jgi:DNA-binding CsgD family transcriptional regulator